MQFWQSEGLYDLYHIVRGKNVNFNATSGTAFSDEPTSSEWRRMQQFFSMLACSVVFFFSLARVITVERCNCIMIMPAAGRARTELNVLNFGTTANAPPTALTIDRRLPLWVARFCIRRCWRVLFPCAIIDKQMARSIFW